MVRRVNNLKANKPMSILDSFFQGRDEKRQETAKKIAEHNARYFCRIESVKDGDNISVWVYIDDIPYKEVGEGFTIEDAKSFVSDLQNKYIAVHRNDKHPTYMTFVF